MDQSLVEFISLLLALGGIGVDANPKAPTAATVLAHAPADADYVAHLDVQAVVPRNYRVLSSLPTAPSIAGNPAAKKMARQMLQEAEAALGMATMMTGMDVVNDLHSITAWVHLAATGDPQFLVVARGDFPADLIDRLAKLGIPATPMNGRSVITSPDGQVTAGLTDGGDFLAGSTAWVTPRLDKSWKPVVKGRDARGAALTAVFAKKPFVAFASSPSATAATRLSAELADGENAAVDLLTRHSFAGVSMTHKELMWRYTAADAAGMQRAASISEGAVDLLRASHLVGRGVLKISLAALESYRGKMPLIDEALKNQDALIALAYGFMGDGTFKSKLDKNTKTKTVTVTASGTKISDIIPIMAFLPVVGGLAWLAGAKGDSEEVAETAQVVDGAMGPRKTPIAPSRRVDARELFRELVSQ